MGGDVESGDRDLARDHEKVRVRWFVLAWMKFNSCVDISRIMTFRCRIICVGGGKPIELNVSVLGGRLYLEEYDPTPLKYVA